MSDKQKHASPLHGEEQKKRDADVIKRFLLGEDHATIAADWGIKASTVHCIASQAGAKLPREFWKTKKHKPETKLRLRAKYLRWYRTVVEDGVPIEEAARHYKVAPSTIRNTVSKIRKEKEMSKQGIRDNVIEDAARMGFHQRKMPPDYRRIEWTLQCSKCPANLVAHWECNMKPEAMAVHARKRGWDTGYGMRPICPTCLHNKDKGPLAKPDHQSFDRFQPKPTAIYDALLDGANKAAIKKQLPELATKIVQTQLDYAGEKQASHDAKVATEEAQRLLAHRQRINDARAQREQRLAQEDAQRRKAEELIEAEVRGYHQGVNDAYTGANTTPQESAPDDQQQPAQTNGYDTNAPQAEKEFVNMANPTPSPKISHAVFQTLDAVFDPARRLYKNGYTDQRVAKDCGTTEEIVAYLRGDLYGALAEDPRITGLRDDLELLRMQAAEDFAKLQKDIAAAQSRLEQMAHHK